METDRRARRKLRQESRLVRAQTLGRLAHFTVTVWLACDFVGVGLIPLSYDRHCFVVFFTIDADIDTVVDSLAVHDGEFYNLSLSLSTGGREVNYPLSGFLWVAMCDVKVLCWPSDLIIGKSC